MILVSSACKTLLTVTPVLDEALKIDAVPKIAFLVILSHGLQLSAGVSIPRKTDHH